MDSSSEEKPSVDSTSQDLAGLDLSETYPVAENMDDMETDCMLVIPDTPDRMISVPDTPLTNHTSSFGFTRRRSIQHRINRDTEGSSSDVMNIESLFREAELASRISNSLEAGAAGQHNRKSINNKSQRSEKLVHKTPLVISPCNDTGRKNGKESHDHGSFISSSEPKEVVSSPKILPTRRVKNDTGVISESSDPFQVAEIDNVAAAVDIDDPVVNRESAPSRRLKSKVLPRTASQRKLVRNGCISQCNTAKVNTGKCNLFPEKTRQFKGKGISFDSDLSENPPSTSYSSPSRYSNPQVMMQNNFIYPLETKNANNDVNSKMGGHENANNKSALPFHVISPDSACRIPVKHKGKEILHETCPKGQDRKPRASRRLTLQSHKDSKFPGYSFDKRCTEAEDLRISQNHGVNVHDRVLEVNRESPLSLSRGHENLGGQMKHINLVEASPATHHTSIPIPVEVSSTTDSGNLLEELRNDGPQNLLKGKRKSRSVHNQHNGNSSSNILRSMLFASSGHHSSTIPNMDENPNQQNIKFPVINVDELDSPVSGHTSTVIENHNTSEISSSRDSQLESDELLARQLQEQLFNESLGLRGAEEIDASLAWTLQQEEDAVRASAFSSRRSEPRDASVAHLYRNYSTERTSNPTRASTRLTRFRRSLNRRQSRTDIQLAQRINYLEALEAAFDDSNDTVISSSLLQTRRDFNESDYEMLLALDNDNHHNAGASVHQINNLPLSIIQVENPEETCTVCLESPSIGDSMRHLPCLHKFHKDCIDKWLKRKTSCPICKSDIT